MDLRTSYVPLPRRAISRIRVLKEFDRNPFVCFSFLSLPLLFSSPSPPVFHPHPLPKGPAAKLEPVAPSILMMSEVVVGVRPCRPRYDTSLASEALVRLVERLYSDPPLALVLRFQRSALFFQGRPELSSLSLPPCPPLLHHARYVPCGPTRNSPSV